MTPPPLTLPPDHPLRPWEADWADFRRSHTDWPAADLDGPVYCLPIPAISRLAKGRGGQPPSLGRGAALAEQAFTRLCEYHYAVGCWDEQPVRFPYLGRATPPPDDDRMRAQGLTPQQRHAIAELSAEAPERQRRQKGYVGWLLTDPDFLGGAARLAGQWAALPHGSRPPPPLRRPLPASAAGNGFFPAPPEVAEFAEALGSFLDHWGLSSLATWDLPVPRAPLVPCPPLPGLKALPARGLYLYVPLHYPLHDDDDFLRRVRECQRTEALHQGLDEGVAGLPHYKAYAHMFDILHLEGAARSRFRAGRPPRGLVGYVQDAAAAALKVSGFQVRRYRKAIAACRRGRRAAVPWLRSRRG